MRPFRLLPLLVLLALAGLARGEGREERGQVRALQAAVRRAVDRVGPSVARILVSRSQDYHKARYWGAPASEPPGQLGRFDPVAAAERVPAKARHRRRILNTLREHDLSDPDNVPESYGSGLVVGKAGKNALVLTNAHVVRNATKVYVRLKGKGRGSWADIHASDPRSDLAVLRLLDEINGLEPLELGGAARVRPGQLLISLTNAYAPGFRDANPTASWGLVSSLRRRAPGDLNEMERSEVTLHHYGTLIQTDARTPPGCSGGVLLNLDGQVVGLTTALAGVRGDTPGALAIPVDASTRRIIATLVRGEEVEYGFLGVTLSDPGPRWRRHVRLGHVSPNSPAQRAGLKPGEYILSINGEPARDTADLFLLIGMTLAGQTARLEVASPDRAGLPRGPRRTVSVKLAKFYVPGPVIASRRPPARAGLRVDYTSILASRGNIPLWGRGPPDGVMIREVVPGSAADKARLQPDKIITHVDGEAVTTPAEFYSAMARAGAVVDLTVLGSDGRPERVTLSTR
jgi:serine protease Do